MNKVRSRTAIHTLLAFALTVLVWVIAYRTVAWEGEQRFVEGAEQARRLAVFFERHTLAAFRYGDAYVKMARREYQNRGGVEAVRTLINEVPLDTSIASHITIIDETGTPLLVSGHKIKPGTTARDRDYFQFQKQNDGDQVLVSLPHRGRNSGKLIVRLVRRITNTDGSFGGVVFVALETEALTRFFSTMNLGPKSSATLVGSNDKRIRARSSYGRLGPGQEISGSRIWRELEQSPVGLYKQLSVVDGITRHYAYRLLSEFPLIVAIGVAAEDLSQAVTQFEIVSYVIATLVTILIATMTFLLSHEILLSQTLTASEAQLEQRVQKRTAELETVQGELLKKERLAVLGQLTGTVAHELRNPLGTITTSTAVIERKLKDSGLDMGDTIKRVGRNVERCNNIITELLDFTRAKGLDLEPTNLDNWLSEVLGEMNWAKDIELRCDLNASGTIIAFDHDRIRRAIINLIDNARDAVAGDDGQGRGEIHVSSWVSADRVSIEIADNGPGIPEDLMPKVHDLLFSTKSFGVGLGIPIVQRVMEEHGGGLEIVSKEGQGTRAVLWLPRNGTGSKESSQS